MKNKKGNMLITVIILMFIATLVVTAAVFTILSSSSSISKVEQGQMAYQAAESGMDEAILQLLRNPNYTGSENNIPTGQATFSLTVSGGATKTIDSWGKFGDFTRHIQTSASYNIGALTVNPWQEVF